MTDTQQQYTDTSTFYVGRRVKLSATALPVRASGPVADVAAIGYTGPAAALCYATAGTPVLIPASTQGIVSAVHSAHHASVLFIWRDGAGRLCAEHVHQQHISCLAVSRGAPPIVGENFAGKDAMQMQAVPSAPALPSLPSGVADAFAQLQATLLASLTPPAPPVPSLDMDAVRGIAQDVATSTFAPWQSMLDAMQSATPSVRARVALAVQQHTSPNAIIKALSAVYRIGAVPSCPVLLASPPSLGKTHSVRQFATQYDAYLEHGCSADMDEIATLLGGPVPDGKGGFLVVDGVLVQAVRTAATGRSVLLLLDELLRLSASAQEWVLTFLTGVQTATGRVYRIRTRRVDPVTGALEVIECPAELLHIVGACNLDARRPSDALWSRFKVRRFAFDSAVVAGVAHSVAALHGIAQADLLVSRFVRAVEVCRERKMSGELAYMLDVRTLARCCADAADADGVLALLVDEVGQQCAPWGVDSGETDPSSSLAVQAVVDALNGGAI